MLENKIHSMIAHAQAYKKVGLLENKSCGKIAHELLPEYIDCCKLDSTRAQYRI